MRSPRALPPAALLLRYFSVLFLYDRTTCHADSLKQPGSEGGQCINRIHLGNVQVTQPMGIMIQPLDQIHTLESKQPPHPIEPQKSTQPLHLQKSIQPLKLLQPQKSIQPVKPLPQKSIQPLKSLPQKSIQPLKPQKSIQPIKPLPQKLIQPLQPIRPLKSIYVESITQIFRQIDTTKQPQSTRLLDTHRRKISPITTLDTLYTSLTDSPSSDTPSTKPAKVFESMTPPFRDKQSTIRQVPINQRIPAPNGEIFDYSKLTNAELRQLLEQPEGSRTTDAVGRKFTSDTLPESFDPQQPGYRLPSFEELERQLEDLETIANIQKEKNEALRKRKESLLLLGQTEHLLRRRRRRARDKGKLRRTANRSVNSYLTSEVHSRRSARLCVCLKKEDTRIGDEIQSAPRYSCDTGLVCSCRNSFSSEDSDSSSGS